MKTFRSQLMPRFWTQEWRNKKRRYK